jgi:spermidine synthase
MMGFLLFKSAPKQIGMVGLGGGSLAKFCYRYLPEALIAVAEIDPSVIALRNYFLIPKDDERLAIYCVDGAEFVRQADSRFDVLMLDGFDKHGQPPQLCSQQYYDDCYRALAPDGILVVNLLGDVTETRIFLERLRTSFSDAVLVVNAPDSLNRIVFACKGGLLNLEERSWRRRIAQLESKYPVGLGQTAQNLMLAHRGVALHDDLHSFDFA